MNQHQRLVFLLLALAVGIIGPFAAGPATAQANPPGQVRPDDHRAQETPEQVATISAALAEQLASLTAGATASFLVVLSEQIDPNVALGALSGEDRDRATSILYGALTTHAADTQADLRAWLSENDVPFRPFYITNMIEVTGDAALAGALLARSDVARLIANPLVAGTNATATVDTTDGWLTALRRAGVVSSPQQRDTFPYGLYATNAVDVWALGYTGAGVIVASQDTGVEWAHPALRPRYRGWDADQATVEHIYNWFDAWGVAGRPGLCALDPQIPCDDSGHGTHTVGTMLGNATDDKPIIGMAPDAQWIGCRNMLSGVGTPSSYAACFEFFLAPYPQDGDPFVDGHPELAPDIINNSWSCPPSEGCDTDALRQVVETVRAAGILVVASAGNSGILGCGSILDPIAIYDATFSVGAHDANGAIAGFSSRGPVTADGSGRPKPDISAPGVAVESAYTGGGYVVLQGTSMASPHVAGAAALLWSAVPELKRDIDSTEQVLIKSAVPVPVSLCTGETATSPNNIFGFGKLDILAAVQLAQAPMALSLQITLPAGMDPAGVAVTVVDNHTGYPYRQPLAADGLVTFSSLYAGDYAVEIDDGDEAHPVGSLTIVPAAGAQTGQLEHDLFGVIYGLDAANNTADTWLYYYPMMMN